MKIDNQTAVETAQSLRKVKDSSSEVSSPAEKLQVDQVSLGSIRSPSVTYSLEGSGGGGGMLPPTVEGSGGGGGMLPPTGGGGGMLPPTVEGSGGGGGMLPPTVEGSGGGGGMLPPTVEGSSDG